MNLLTALKLVGVDGFSFVAEKGAYNEVGSTSRITLKEEYRNEAREELSGRITSISRDGLHWIEKFSTL